jgi:hypothetical protein
VGNWLKIGLCVIVGVVVVGVALYIWRLRNENAILTANVAQQRVALSAALVSNRQNLVALAVLTKQNELDQAQIAARDAAEVQSAADGATILQSIARTPARSNGAAAPVMLDTLRSIAADQASATHVLPAHGAKK